MSGLLAPPAVNLKVVVSVRTQTPALFHTGANYATPSKKAALWSYPVILGFAQHDTDTAPAARTMPVFVPGCESSSWSLLR